MIRLFNAYFPTRTLLLTVTEVLLVTLGFVLAVEFWAGTASDASIYLLYENGLGRIGLVVAVFLILMYYFDLYDSFVLANRREVITRLVGVLGCAFVALAVLYYVFPEVSLGGSTLWVGVGIVGVAVPAWRRLFFCAQSLRSFFREGYRLRRRAPGRAADGGDRPPFRTRYSGRGFRRSAGAHGPRRSPV